MKKKTLEAEINEFLEVWNQEELLSFLTHIIPLVELFYTEEEGDWVAQIVGEENEQNIRFIRTVYLLSRIAELHAGKLASTKINFKNLYLRMEREGIAKGEHGN